MNPQRWNKYAYALNSPLVLDDPTGKDAAAVNFSGMVAGLGHEAIVVINPDGSAQLASFGPAVKDAVGLWGAGGEPGQVQTYPLPTIQFGADGLPTDASMAALRSALAKDMSTKGETVNPNTVRINYFKTTPQETANLETWIAQQKSLPNWYSALCVRGSRNCATFTGQGLVAGGAITQSQANGLSIIPDEMFDELEMLAPLNSDSSGNAKVTASECDKEPNGQENCYQD